MTLFQDKANRIMPHIGRWKGYSVTKRSGIYGATIAEADTVASLEIDDKGHLIQVFCALLLLVYLIGEIKGLEV